MFKLWINNIPIVTIPYSNAKSVTLMILQLIRLEYIHGHCCSWWMIDIAFCQVFLLSCSATLFTAVFFTRKQQLAKYNTAFVLDFWSLQTTLPNLRTGEPEGELHLLGPPSSMETSYLPGSLEVSCLHLTEGLVCLHLKRTWNCFSKTCWPNRLDEM